MVNNSGLSQIKTNMKRATKYRVWILNISNSMENINIKSIYVITLYILNKPQKTFYSNSLFQLSEIQES